MLRKARASPPGPTVSPTDWKMIERRGAEPAGRDGRDDDVRAGQRAVETGLGSDAQAGAGCLEK
jgi:hypothetical protein